ncbi:MAG: 2-phosphosulfolactate phosphatase, partial [Bacteroidales bacterium]
MEIEILQLIEGARQAMGLTVIIDVFRAFSLACYIFDQGAEKIIPVGDIDMAYRLKENNPGYLLAG